MNANYIGVLYAVERFVPKGTPSTGDYPPKDSWDRCFVFDGSFPGNIKHEAVRAARRYNKRTPRIWRVVRVERTVIPL